MLQGRLDREIVPKEKQPSSQPPLKKVTEISPGRAVLLRRMQETSPTHQPLWPETPPRPKKISALRRRQVSNPAEARKGQLLNSIQDLDSPLALNQNPERLKKLISELIDSITDGEDGFKHDIEIGHWKYWERYCARWNTPLLRDPENCNPGSPEYNNG